MRHSTVLICLLGLVSINFCHAMECILVAGGQITPEYIEYFCPDLNTSCLIQDTFLLQPRADHVAGMLNGDVILAGGQHGISSETFNPETWEQRKRGDMVVPFLLLNFPGAAVVNGSFHVCGGGPYDLARSIFLEGRNACTTYNGREWTEAEPMNYPRAGHGFVAVDHYLYAFGGVGEPEPDWPYHPVHLSSMERFDIHTRKWVEMARMLTPRKTFGSAVLGDYIYACGGGNWYHFFSSCERYDIEKNSWEYVANMTIPRDQFTMTPVNGKLYAIGGYLGERGGMGVSIEAYDPDRNTWVLLGNLTTYTAGHSATLVHLEASNYICSKPTTTSTTTTSTATTTTVTSTITKTTTTTSTPKTTATTVTTTAKPDSASLYSPIHIIGLFFLGFWVIREC